MLLYQTEILVIMEDGRKLAVLYTAESRSEQMYKIVTKRELNDTVTLMEIEAPHIARTVYHFPRGRAGRARPPDNR